MKTKLTLSVDSEVVAQAKRLARNRGVSVSALFEIWSTQLAVAVERPSFGKSLRGQWKKKTALAGDARLEFLLGKHVR